MKNLPNEWQKTETVPLKLRTGQKFTLSSLIFTIILEVLASATRKEKYNKVTQIRKEENCFHS